MIPCLFQLNFVFFLPVCIFLLLYYTFRFLRPVKGARISLRTIRYILDIHFIPLIYSYSYLHCFIYNHLLILIYTYLSILIFVVFILLLYEFDKTDKVFQVLTMIT